MVSGPLHQSGGPLGRPGDTQFPYTTSLDLISIPDAGSVTVVDTADGVLKTLEPGSTTYASPGQGDTAEVPVAHRALWPATAETPTRDYAIRDASGYVYRQVANPTKPRPGTTWPYWVLHLGSPVGPVAE